MSQWAELNSARLINPVFRLFQNELETVYEEKNMYSDNFIMPAFEAAEKAFFGNHPYAYPIIGSTENLKSPRLSEMNAFFKKYYVASNMGLILCGDFNADSIGGLLEKTFGRIERGVAPNRDMPALQPLTCNEVKIKAPIPIIKAEGILFRSPTDRDNDATALNMAVALLSNSNSTGFLDSLTNEHKVMQAQAFRESLNDAGMLGFAFVPKPPFGSNGKIEKLCWEQIDKLKQGDFPENAVSQLKLEAMRKSQSQLESIDSRAQLMIDAFSKGESWKEYIDRMNAVQSITKTDVVRAAQKYFNNSYLKLVKKFGSYPTEKVKQPGYSPITPKNANAMSQYAKHLDSIPVKNMAPRLIDFDKDVKTSQLNQHVTLYTAENKVNDLFNISLIFHNGEYNKPILDAVASYVSMIGTDSLTKQQLGKALQQLGTTLSANATQSTFTLSMTGFDKNLKPSLELLDHFMKAAKADNESMKDLITSYKLEAKTFSKENVNMATALFYKIAYGDKSDYLRHTTADELKAMKGEDLIQAFKDVLKSECSIVYSGKYDLPTVQQMVASALPVDAMTEAHPEVHRTMMTYQEPVVYLYNMPSRQNYVGTYQSLKPCTTPVEKARQTLWSTYFGGGMSSLLFQEIREFRSYAYFSGGKSMFPASAKHTDDPTAYCTMTGTQADKTMKALGVLDSLFSDMPVREANMAVAKNQVVNDINNAYPSFRGIGGVVVRDRLNGYNKDPDAKIINGLSQLSNDDIMSFYNSQIKNGKRVTIIVGNKKTLDMKALAKYGKIIEVTKTDIYK
jgi:predicted Zn-dependent peptidase